MLTTPEKGYEARPWQGFYQQTEQTNLLKHHIHIFCTLRWHQGYSRKVPIIKIRLHAEPRAMVLNSNLGHNSALVSQTIQ